MHVDLKQLWLLILTIQVEKPFRKNGRNVGMASTSIGRKEVSFIYVDHTINSARGLWGRSVRFCHNPLVKTKLVDSHCLALYGSVLWNMGNKHIKSLEVIFNSYLQQYSSPYLEATKTLSYRYIAPNSRSFQYL